MTPPRTPAVTTNATPAAAKPGEGGRGNYEQADKSTDQPVGVLDKCLELEWGNHLTMTERPIGAAQARFGDPDDASKSDLAKDRNQRGNGDGPEQGRVAHEGREAVG